MKSPLLIFLPRRAVVPRLRDWVLTRRAVAALCVGWVLGLDPLRAANDNITNPRTRPVPVLTVDESGNYVAPGGGAGGGLTDAQLRAAAVPVSMAAVPVGAATAAAQATAQATLATIATNTTIPALVRFRNTGVTNTAVAVKASAGNVHGWNVINPNTVPTYLKFYDIAAGSVTVGTSTVTLTIAIPANGAFFVRSEMVPQQSFTTAISVAAVSGLADNSAAAPSSAVHVSVQYQ